MDQSFLQQQVCDIYLLREDLVRNDNSDMELQRYETVVDTELLLCLHTESEQTEHKI